LAKAKLGLVSSFEDRVKKAMNKERIRTAKILNSDPDPVTKQQTLNAYSEAEKATRKRISAEDFKSVLDRANSLKTVVSIETRRKEKADTEILNLMRGDLSNPNTKTNLVFARRTSEDANGKITQSLVQLNKLGSDLTNTSARSVQFGNKKRTFAP
jgi:hypothetical protein